MNIRTLLAALLVLGIPLTALAQNKPVPITLTPDDLGQLMQGLQELPYKYATPLIGFFQQREAASQAAANPKPAPKAPQTVQAKPASAKKK